MKSIFVALVLIAQVASAGLQKYSSLVVADANPAATVPSNTIRATYLGVNGFQFETSGHVLLVDPYFTRVGLSSAALNQPIQSDANRVGEGLRHVRPRADALLVTHAHFDHLLDAPEIMRGPFVLLRHNTTGFSERFRSIDVHQRHASAKNRRSKRRIGVWVSRLRL